MEVTILIIAAIVLLIPMLTLWIDDEHDRLRPKHHN